MTGIQLEPAQRRAISRKKIAVALADAAAILASDLVAVSCSRPVHQYSAQLHLASAAVGVPAAAADDFVEPGPVWLAQCGPPRRGSAPAAERHRARRVLDDPGRVLLQVCDTPGFRAAFGGDLAVFLAVEREFVRFLFRRARRAARASATWCSSAQAKAAATSWRQSVTNHGAEPRCSGFYADIPAPQAEADKLDLPYLGTVADGLANGLPTGLHGIIVDPSKLTGPCSTTCYATSTTTDISLKSLLRCAASRPSD